MSVNPAPTHLVPGWLGLLAALTACGSGDPTSSPPPPPAPVVTSVVVAPATAGLTEGDTVRLAATPRDQSGAAMTGQPVAWATSNAAVASVSASGLVTALTAGSATITAAVGSVTGTAAITVAALPRVVLDAGRSASTVIGSAGGTVTAASASGLRYDLVVPPLALDSAVTITITPLKAFNKLPLSGGLVGAVEFQPAGLRFRAPATLTIKAAPAVPANQRLVGFSFGTGGDSVAVKPAAPGNGQVAVLVSHFSGAGVALATVQDLAALPPAPNSAAQDTAFVTLAGLALPADAVAIAAVFRRWQTALVNRLQLAQTDVAVRDGRGEFAAWTAQLQSYPASDGAALRVTLAPELATLRVVLSAAYGRGIAFANQQCGVQQSFVAAKNVLFLQLLATADSVAGPGAPAERSTVLAGLCVHPIVVDSLYSLAPAPGVPGALDLRIGWQFSGAPGPVKFMTTNLALDIHGSLADRAVSATTDTLGRFSVQIAPVGGVQLSVAVQACPVPTVFGFDYPCLAFTLQRNFGRTVTGNVTVSTQGALAALADVSRITGSLTITGSGVTSTDLAELRLLATVDGAMTIGPVPSLTSLRGLDALTRVGGQVNLALPQLTSLGGPRHLASVGASLVIGNMPLLTSLDGLQSLARVDGALTLSNDAALNDLSALGALAHLGALRLAQLPALASLHGLEGVTALDAAGLAIEDLGLLTDLAPLGGLRRLKSLTLLRLPGLVDLLPLRAAPVAADLMVVGLSNLATLSGLAPLPPSAGTVSVRENPKLRDLAPLVGATSLASLAVSDNAQLADLHELSGVTAIAGFASISGDQLTSLGGLSSLRHAGGIVVDLFRSPRLNAIALPALADLVGTNGINLSPASCPGGRTIAVTLISLTSTTGLFLGNGDQPSDCTYTLSAPQLTVATQGVTLSGGVASVQLGGAFRSPQLAYLNTKLTTLSVPTLDVGILLVQANQQLVSLGSGSGTVSTRIEFRNNGALSTQAINTWTANFTTPAKVVTGNKQP